MSASDKHFIQAWPNCSSFRPLFLGKCLQPDTGLIA